MNESPNAHPLLQHWRLKLPIAAVLAIIYCSAYLLIERHLFRSPTRFNLSPIDQRIPFNPQWVWIYQSIYLLLPLPFLATTRDEIRRYTIGFALIMLIAFTCFILYPVQGPRLPSIHPTGMYAFLISIDLPFNTFPSLHIAIATYSAAAAIQVTHNPLRRTLKIILPSWILLIAYSALATKQHYVIDLPTGALLGYLAQRIAWSALTADHAPH